MKVGNKAVVVHERGKAVYEKWTEVNERDDDSDDDSSTDSEDSEYSDIMPSEHMTAKKARAFEQRVSQLLDRQVQRPVAYGSTDVWQCVHCNSYHKKSRRLYPKVVCCQKAKATMKGGYNKSKYKMSFRNTKLWEMEEGNNWNVTKVRSKNGKMLYKFQAIGLKTKKDRTFWVPVVEILDTDKSMYGFLKRGDYDYWETILAELYHEYHESKSWKNEVSDEAIQRKTYVLVAEETAKNVERKDEDVGKDEGDKSNDEAQDEGKDEDKYDNQYKGKIESMGDEGKNEMEGESKEEDDEEVENENEVDDNDLSDNDDKDEAEGGWNGNGQGEDGGKRNCTEGATALENLR